MRCRYISVLASRRIDSEIFTPLGRVNGNSGKDALVFGKYQFFDQRLLRYALTTRDAFQCQGRPGTEPNIDPALAIAILAAECPACSITSLPLRCCLHHRSLLQYYSIVISILVTA